MSLELLVIGCGHVGLVTAAGFAELGHRVIGVDSDPDRLAQLQRGTAPFHEPGLQELVTKHHGGNLHFDADPRAALQEADAAFICVNTPPRPDGRLSLAYVEQATRTIAEHAPGPLVVVQKSTVLVRTAWRIADVLKQEGRYPEIEVVSNPEFLREGSAVHDTLHPDRIVVGLAGDGRSEALIRELYAPLIERAGCPLIVTDLETAELIKHASNAFLAMKISYINAVAELCEKTGADVDVVAEAMGLDPRIGPDFLRAGVGYGGSCFPKDVTSFARQAVDAGVELDMLEEVQRINARQRTRLVEKVRQALWNIEGKTIAVWGLSFKPGTDDLREAPALDVIPALRAEGARIRAYDPAATEEAKSVFPDVEFAADPLAAADGADGLVILTDWPEFGRITPAELGAMLRKPVVIDGRNIWSCRDMAAAGFTYFSFGRPDVVSGETRRPS